jgi:hypothetical protein
MTNLKELWRRKSDDRILEALAYLSDYNDEAQAAIRAECVRRGLTEHTDRPITLKEAQSAARLHRLFACLVLGQWLSMILLIAGPGVFPVSIDQALRSLAALVMAGAMIATPLTGFRLLKRLEAESPGGTVIFMYAPLVSLLALFGLKSLAERWGKLHGIEVGFLGPSAQSLEQLSGRTH